MFHNFFKSKGLPAQEKYPEEEAIVNDYVKRGIVYFVFDFVEVSQETRFIEPVTYKFKSKALYYPLKTSNTFGGEGSIELIIIAPTTLCSAGNGPFDPYSGALYNEENPGTPRPYNRPLCLNIPVKASTSALIVKEEKDIEEIYPEGESFFKDQKAFIQIIRYEGKYFFNDDIFVDVSTGFSLEVGAFEEDRSNPFLSGLEKFTDELFWEKQKCSSKPERGPCKGNFKRYYYDLLSNKCKEFLWGGCGGVVPFATKIECEKCYKTN